MRSAPRLLDALCQEEVEDEEEGGAAAKALSQHRQDSGCWCAWWSVSSSVKSAGNK